MKRKTYIAQIKKQCKNVGTYREEFSGIINKLAEMLENYDNVFEDFKNGGEEITIEYTNKNGSTNLVKNPMYLVLTELRKDILSYYRELGLTPQGLKKYNEKLTETSKTKSALDMALSNFKI